MEGQNDSRDVTIYWPVFKAPQCMLKRDEVMTNITCMLVFIIENRRDICHQKVFSTLKMFIVSIYSYHVVTELHSYVTSLVHAVHGYFVFLDLVSF